MITYFIENHFPSEKRDLLRNNASFLLEKGKAGGISQGVILWRADWMDRTTTFFNEVLNLLVRIKEWKLDLDAFQME